MEEKTVEPIVSTPEKPVEQPVVAETPKEEVKPEAQDKTESDPEAGKADPLLDGYYKTNPFFYEVAEYFNLETRDYDEAAPKLSVIVDWIVQTFDVHKPEDILMKLREGEDMVQPPTWGEKRYTNLFKYARLAAQGNSIKKAMSAFERKPND